VSNANAALGNWPTNNSPSPPDKGGRRGLGRGGTYYQKAKIPLAYYDYFAVVSNLEFPIKIAERMLEDSFATREAIT
jgi:hypothetical protein